MSDIDQPSLKEILWHQMRGDLSALVPYFADNNLLLCPVCCRPLKYEQFSVEHILPKQAVGGDAQAVRNAVSRNDRSGLTLICQSPLYVKGQLVHSLGCNSWKGKYYDSFLRQAIRANIAGFNQRHHLALFAAAYLGLVSCFGFRIALQPSGLLLRQQFFSPDRWLKTMPTSSQMVLMGEEITKYDDSLRGYWSEPFKFAMNGAYIVVVLRSISMMLPISSDPMLPMARALPYAPPQFKLKPDLSSVFD